MTCSNYTSDAEDQFVMLGHHDRAGTAPISPWNAAHPSTGCNNERLVDRQRRPALLLRDRLSDPVREWLRRRQFADNAGRH